MPASAKGANNFFSKPWNKVTDPETAPFDAAAVNVRPLFTMASMCKP